MEEGGVFDGEFVAVLDLDGGPAAMGEEEEVLAGGGDAGMGEAERKGERGGEGVERDRGVEDGDGVERVAEKKRVFEEEIGGKEGFLLDDEDV